MNFSQAEAITQEILIIKVSRAPKVRRHKNDLDFQTIARLSYETYRQRQQRQKGGEKFFMFLAAMLCSTRPHKPSDETINNHHRNWFKLYFSCVVPFGPTWYYSRVACFVFCFHQVPTCLERSSKKYWLSKKNWKQVARSILRVHETAHIQQMMKHQNGKFSTRVKRVYEVNVKNMTVFVRVTCRICRKLCLCCCCLRETQRWCYIYFNH